MVHFCSAPWPNITPPLTRKSRITALEAEANAGGTPEYRECVEGSYAYEQHVRFRIAKNGGKPFRRHDWVIGSGLPAGTLLYAFHDAMGLPPARPGRTWFNGPDKDVVRYENVNFEPWGPPRTGTAWPNRMRYSQRMVTARPLPAGNYVVYPNWIWPGGEVCNGFRAFAEELADLTVAHLAVAAPPYTVHEAFFDPVAIGAGVGADGSNGVLKPAAFTVGGASATVTSLTWETGVVTMELDPSASLAGHAVDFIALDGSVSLTLSFDDATQGGGSLTWSVAAQPWNAGDLLMLRIRSANVIITPPTATPTPMPTVAPTATPTATPTPAATPTPTPMCRGCLTDLPAVSNSFSARILRHSP